MIPGYNSILTAEDCIFDPQAAQDAMDFFQHPEDGFLRHVKGEMGGKPFKLGKWQQSIIANIFGWKRPNGSRRFRKVFFFVPRKNGKTALAAGIVLTVMFTDGEPGAELYSAASDKDQAALVYEHAKGMVLQEPLLKERCRVYAATKTIHIEETSSTYKVLSAEADSKHGFNAHLVVIDELHAQPNADLVDVLITSVGARRQPLIMYTTTSDYDKPSICNEEYEYACKVRDGIVKDSAYLPIIYEANAKDDWKDEKTWERANPAIHDIPTLLPYLREQFKTAMERPSFQNTFKRLHLNIKTSQDVLWLDMERWDLCSDLEVSPLSMVGKKCYTSLDLSSTTDMTCVLHLFPEMGNFIIPRFYIPEDVVKEREKKGLRPDYKLWVEQGFLRTTPGNIVDYEYIERDILVDSELYNIQEIITDPWNSTGLQAKMMGHGFDVVPFRQGFASLSSPSKELEAVISRKAFNHQGNPVMRWMASNAMIEMDAAANIKPSKSKSSNKIDGIVALVMGIGRTMINSGSTKSVYSTRGIRSVGGGDSGDTSDLITVQVGENDD